jgi:hypothetical protein
MQQNCSALKINEFIGQTFFFVDKNYKIYIKGGMGNFLDIWYQIYVDMNKLLSEDEILYSRTTKKFDPNLSQFDPGLVQKWAPKYKRNRWKKSFKESNFKILSKLPLNLLFLVNFN